MQSARPSDIPAATSAESCSSSLFCYYIPRLEVKKKSLFFRIILVFSWSQRCPRIRKIWIYLVALMRYLDLRASTLWCWLWFLQIRTICRAPLIADFTNASIGMKLQHLGFMRGGGGVHRLVISSIGNFFSRRLCSKSVTLRTLIDYILPLDINFALKRFC